MSPNRHDRIFEGLGRLGRGCPATQQHWQELLGTSVIQNTHAQPQKMERSNGWAAAPPSPLGVVRGWSWCSSGWGIGRGRWATGCIWSKLVEREKKTEESQPGMGRAPPSPLGVVVV
jgi:hypothetical protein